MDENKTTPNSAESTEQNQSSTENTVKPTTAATATSSLTPSESTDPKSKGKQSRNLIIIAVITVLALIIILLMGLVLILLNNANSGSQITETSSTNTSESSSTMTTTSATTSSSQSSTAVQTTTFTAESYEDLHVNPILLPMNLYQLEYPEGWEVEESEWQENGFQAYVVNLRKNGYDIEIYQASSLGEYNECSFDRDHTALGAHNMGLFSNTKLETQNGETLVYEDGENVERLFGTIEGVEWRKISTGVGESNRITFCVEESAQTGSEFTPYGFIKINYETRNEIIEQEALDIIASLRVV